MKKTVLLAFVLMLFSSVIVWGFIIPTVARINESNSSSGDRVLVFASSKIIWVPDNFTSIQEAINNASDGDAIFVRAGTYYENVVVNKTVALIGEDRNTTIIDGNQTGTVVTVTADGVSISGFIIQNGEVGVDLNSNGNTITSNIFSSNGAQEIDLKTNLEVYPDPPASPVWRYLYDLINGSYTELLNLTTETPVLGVKVVGHSDVAELALGLFYDENEDDVPQFHEFVGFAIRGKEVWVYLYGPPKGRYIIKVQGYNVLGNPGHFDREVTKFRGYGIGTHQSFNNVISENLITENYAGLYIQSSSGMTVSMNNVTKNIGGIIAEDLVDSIFYANEVFSNDFSDTIGVGISLRASRNINLTNNVLSLNAFGINLWNSSHNNVRENKFYSHLGWGIGLHASSDNNLVDNNISVVNVLDGIRLVFSSRNNLIGNSMSECEHSGILLWYDCYNNSVVNNNIQLSGIQGVSDGHGMEVLLSSNNVFENNVISQARVQGIIAIEASNNVFTGNLVSSNDDGIILWSSSGNWIYHNSIIDNLGQQGYDDTGDNFWDAGYPSGGNYWSDYTGVDLYGGSYQNETGSDGIGDAPHIIEGNSQDNYPLMGMFSDFNATSEHRVQTICNSSISDFRFNGTAISFYVTGENDTTGFCRIRIPTALMNGTYKVFVNGTEVSYTLLPCSNNTHSYLYFTYNHSTQEVIIIPELPTWTSILLLLVLTVAVAVYKRRLFCCS